MLLRRESISVSLICIRVIVLLRRVKQAVRTYNILVLITDRVVGCFMLYQIHVFSSQVGRLLDKLRTLLWWRLALIILLARLRYFLLVVVLIIVIGFVVSVLGVVSLGVLAKDHLPVLLLTLAVHCFVAVHSVLRA